MAFSALHQQKEQLVLVVGDCNESHHSAIDEVARGWLSSARPCSTTRITRGPPLTHLGVETVVIGQGGPLRAPRVDGGMRCPLRIREILREAAAKETTVPPVQLPLSIPGGPLREIREPGIFCPLLEPLRASELRSVPIAVEPPRKCGAVARHAMGRKWVSAPAVVAAPVAEPTLDTVAFEARVAKLQVGRFGPMHNLPPDEAAAPALKARAFNAPGR